MSKWKELKEAEKPQEVEAIEPIGMDEAEKALEEQLDEALVAFQNRRERENKRFREVTDTNYYFVVCFTNNDQMIEFCNEFGLDVSYKYYDGREVARKFRKVLKTPDTPTPKEKARNKGYAKRAMGIKQQN